MNFIDRLTTVMTETGVTAYKINKDLGISEATIRQWKKKPETEPSATKITRIADYFTISVEWLLNGKGPKYSEDVIPHLDDLKNKLGLITELEFSLIENFRILPENEKYRILGNIESKAEIFSAGQSDVAVLISQDIKTPLNKNGAKVSGGTVYTFNESADADKVRKVKMKIYAQAASAGLGNYLNDSSDYEFIEFDEDEVPSIADFGILINGDSMEPDIEHGDIVWVEEQVQIESGEIGIFILNNEALCKELLVNYRRRMVQLISLNPKYKPIKLGENDDLRTVGRVILH